MVKVMLGLGAAMVVLGWWVALNTKAFRISSLRAEARVESRTEAKRTPDRKIEPATLTLRYIHEGKEYRPTVNAIDKYWAALKPGDSIRLVLLPKNPERFVPEASLSDSSKGEWLRLIFFMAGLLLVGFSQILRARS